MYSNGAILTRTRKEMNLYEFNYNMNILDILAAQGYGQICSHIDIINRYRVKLFIELGVYMGGTLPHVIPNLVLDDEFNYIGFEILADAVKEKVKRFASQNPRCQLILENMFAQHNLDRIAASIRDTKGAAYIFCDGGNKPKELIVFSRYMRVGDIISVHDYTDDQTGEIKDVDLAKLGDSFAPLDEQWRKDILWLPTFMKVK